MIRAFTGDSDRGLSRGTSGNRDRNNEHAVGDAFTRDVDLPRGRERRLVRERDRVYVIDGAKSRTLATIGAFRVVARGIFMTCVKTPRVPAKPQVRGGSSASDG